MDDCSVTRVSSLRIRQVCAPLADSLPAEYALAASDTSVVIANLGVTLKDAGLMEEAVAAYRRALELDPSDSATRSALLFSLAYLHGVTPELLVEEARAFGGEHCAPWRSLRTPLRNDRDPGGVSAVDARALLCAYGDSPRRSRAERAYIEFG
jgi:tetratricopeptide (TPR) repeat protein